MLYGSVFVTSLHTLQATKLTAFEIILACYIANNRMASAVPRRNHSCPVESVVPKKEDLSRPRG